MIDLVSIVCKINSKLPLQTMSDAAFGILPVSRMYRQTRSRTSQKHTPTHACSGLSPSVRHHLNSGLSSFCSLHPSPETGPGIWPEYSHLCTAFPTRGQGGGGQKEQRARQGAINQVPGGISALRYLSYFPSSLKGWKIPGALSLSQLKPEPASQSRTDRRTDRGSSVTLWVSKQNVNKQIGKCCFVCL